MAKESNFKKPVRKLDAETKLGALLDEHPFLLDFLPTLSAHYMKLKNPILRRTVARRATLQMVAEMGGLRLEKLVDEIGRAIDRAQGGAKPKSARPSTPEERQEVLKGIIKDLHAGADMESIKKRFSGLIQDIAPAEIGRMEQALISEGMPETEVKRLCDVHVQVFKGALDEQEVPRPPEGHPVHTLMLENRECEKILSGIEEAQRALGEKPALGKSRAALEALYERLGEIERHYRRKENQLFPRLEAHGVSGPTQVMWAVHDDIRAAIKKARAAVAKDRAAEAVSAGDEVVRMVRDMIYKEEHILYPMSLETLTDEDWKKVKEGESEIGFSWVKPVDSSETPVSPRAGAPSAAGAIALSTGNLTAEQVDLMLTNLPVDISFVDVNDRVAYYSATKERIFPRSPGVIGREVRKCHPPKSVDKVLRILTEFKAGRKNVAEFWIQVQGRFLHIRYFALRDAAGKYRGTLEVTQDVTGIRTLEGERRLLDWK